MQTERQLQRDCLRHARSLGVWARKIETPNYNGCPDCLFIYEGRFMFVEFKTPKGTGRLSPLQIAEHARLSDVRVTVRVINNKEVFENEIAKFIRYAPTESNHADL